mgnify:FL=1
MRVLLIDNSKPHLAFYTPKLNQLLGQHADVTVCGSVDDTTKALDTRWDAIVLSGSSLNVSETLRANAIAKDLMVLLRRPGTPVLGVCFGMQLIAVAYGGDVDRLDTHREGLMMVNATSDHGTSGIAHFSHQDVVCSVPPGFCVDAKTDDGIIAEMHSRELKRYGVQYHPEASPESTRRTIYDFLKMARQCHLQIGDELVSTDEYARIALLMGKATPQAVAAMFNVDRITVECIWHNFRAQFRIPAIMY